MIEKQNKFRRLKRARKKHYLAVLIDQKLNFEMHFYTVGRKGKSEATCSRQRLCLRNTRIVMKVFIMSKFSTYPLIWMLHNRGNNALTTDDSVFLHR